MAGAGVSMIAGKPGEAGIPVGTRLAASLGMQHRGRRGKPRLHGSFDNRQPSTAAIEPLFRLLDCRTFLRKRRDFGVTSTNSSSAMNSIACSRLRLR
jgi:hypothetical protein